MTHQEKRERKDEIIRQYGAGDSISSLAIRHGLDAGYVRRILRQSGAALPSKPRGARRGTRREVSPRTRQVIFALGNSNATTKALAYRFQISRQRVQQIRDHAIADGELKPRSNHSKRINALDDADLCVH